MEDSASYRPLVPGVASHEALVASLEQDAPSLAGAAERAAGLAWDSAPGVGEAPGALDRQLSCVARRALGSALFGADHDVHGSPLPAALDALGNVPGPASAGRLDFLLRRHAARRRETGEGADALAGLVAVHGDDVQACGEAVSLARACMGPSEVLLHWAVAVAARIPGGPLPHGFLHELLRLYPPAWLQRFAVLHEVELSGERLLPGDEAWTSPFVTQRMERLYPQPDRFDAARAPASTPWAFFPFGAREGGAVARLVVAVVAGAVRALAARTRMEAHGELPQPGDGELLRPGGALQVTLLRR